MSYLNIIEKARNTYGIPSGNQDNTILAATALKNLEDYGYTFGKEGYTLLSSASEKDITDWYYETAEKLQKLSGGNHQYKPFYPNFPEQVMELSDWQRFVEQISHYVFGYMPEGENKKEGIKSLESSKLKVLGVIDLNDKKTIKTLAAEIFRNTLASKQNINETTYRDIVREYMKSDALWMKEAGIVTNRSTLCMLYFDALIQKKNTESLPAMVTKDYLRLAKLFSMGKEKKNSHIIITDPEIYDKQKIGSLPNNVRTFIIKGLNNQVNLEEDVARDVTGFKALFKYMHVGAKEYSKYTDVQEVANKIRNNQPLETFYSKMERYFKYINNARTNADYNSFSKAYEKILNHLGKRPGEFIKRIDRIISEGSFSKDSTTEPTMRVKELTNLLQKAEVCFKKTRPEDLINFIEFMNSRTNPYRLAIHNVRGNLILDTDKKYIPYEKEFVEKLTDIAKKSISEQLYSGKSYGKVYIDPDMDKMTLPKDRVSDNDISTYPKGSRLPIEKAADGSSKNLRFFVWWTNNEKSVPVDIDISAKLYKLQGDKTDLQSVKGRCYIENEQYMHKNAEVAYHSSYNTCGCTHSGDITNGGSPDGAGVCEYIDLNLDELKANDIKYVQMYLNIYSSHASGGFSGLTNCEFGYQERKELDKSEQFNIKAVKQHGKLDSTSSATTPCIIDVDKAEVIWIDVPDKGARNYTNALSATPIDIIMDKYANEYRLSMGELARLAVTANGGEYVDSPKDADVIFMVDNYEDATKDQRVITSKDADVWLGEFMSPVEHSESEVKEKEYVTEKQQDNSKADVNMDKLQKLQQSFNALQEEFNDFIESHNLQTDVPQDESEYEEDVEEIEDEDIGLE